MRVPGKLKKVKPNEIVVFDNYGNISGTPFNALSQDEDGNVLFFDTKYYETTGKPTFYNEHGIETVLGYDIDCIEFARSLDRIGISPSDLKEHLHDFKWVTDIVQKENQKMLETAPYFPFLDFSRL